MNPYGKRAQAFWETYRPQATAALPDPEAFFTAIGEEVAAQIEEDALDFQEKGTPGQGVHDVLGSLNTARYRAREKAMQELVYDREKEPGTEDLDMPQTEPLPSLRVDL